MIHRARPAAVGTVVLAVACAVTPSAQATPEAPSTRAAAAPTAYNKWAWFKDTYWIVPKKGIYSVMHVQDGNKWVVTRGQTVFHIQDYFNGYWTGSVVVKLSRAKVTTCQFVLGQVTPEGNVYMTMFSADTGEIVNNPVGSMVRKQGEWSMVNQMTGPSSDGTSSLSHWAYMMQSKKGDATYKNLPFVHQSIPDFMGSCPKAPPLIVPER
ncbi:MAG: hypothetical protein ACR2KE_06780 [Candidatus Nanopelagicales bacterium]